MGYLANLGPTLASLLPAEWWRLPAAQRRLAGRCVLFGMTMLFALLAWAVQVHLTLVQAELNLQHQQNLWKQQLSAQSAAASAPQADLQTQVRSLLPWHWPMPDVIKIATQRAQDLALRLNWSSPGTPEAVAGVPNLWQGTATVKLLGSYSQCKLWLSELLAQFPSLAVLVMNWHVSEQPGQVELQLSLRLWSQTP